MHVCITYQCMCALHTNACVHYSLCGRRVSSSKLWIVTAMLWLHRQGAAAAAAAALPLYLHDSTVHAIPTAFPLYFPYISLTFPLHFPYISLIFPLYFPYISLTFPSYFLYISLIFPLFTFPLHFPYISLTFPLHFPYATRRSGVFARRWSANGSRSRTPQPTRSGV